jgi:hypothetical protein
VALGPKCGWPAGPRTPPPWPDASEGWRGRSDKGGDLGGVRQSGGRIDSQDQPADRPKNTSGTMSHHGVSVPGVVMFGDRVVHRCLRGHGCGRPATVIDDDWVGESGRARRGAWICQCRGRGAPAVVVDDGWVGETGPACRRGCMGCRRGQRGHTWHEKCRHGCMWHRQGRWGRVWGGKNGEWGRRGRRSHTRRR